MEIKYLCAYLQPQNLIQLQQLSKFYYDTIPNYIDQCKIDYQSEESASSSLIQYFNGYVMSLDFAWFKNQTNAIDEITKAYHYKLFSWQIT